MSTCGCTNPVPMQYLLQALSLDGASFVDAVKSRITTSFPSLEPSSGSYIFYNGTIRTIEGGNADVIVDALAISGENIVQAGALEDCRKAAPTAQEINLNGKTLLPGFFEPHVHLLPTSLYDTWVQLTPFDGQYLLGTSYKEQWVYDTLNAAIANGLVRNGWLMGFGVDPSMFSDMTPEKDWMDPTKQELDSKVSDEIPIFLMNSSGHVAYANTPALNAANYESETGILTEFEMFKVLQVALVESAGSLPEFLTVTLKAMSDMLQRAAAQGVTTLFDAALGSSGSMNELVFFDELAKSGRCPQRLGGGVIMSDPASLEAWRAKGLTPTSFQGERFHVPNVKIVSDGSNQGLTGYQSQDYVNPNPIINTPGHERGIWNLGDGDGYKQFMQDIEQDGWTLMIHANGDLAISKVIAGYEQVVANSTVGQRKHRIEHCSILTDQHIDDMVRLGLSASFLIGHVGYWGRTMTINVFGLNKAELLDRTASVAQRGMRFTLHSDHFVSPLGPLRMAEQSCLRYMEALSPQNEALNKEECIDIKRALRAITYDAAWQCHLESIVGELTVGKRADLVILEEDPVTRSTIKGLRDIKVNQTWLSGTITHSL